MTENNLGLTNMENLEEACYDAEAESFADTENSYSVPGDSVILYTNLNTQLSTHFRVRDFACSCPNQSCHHSRGYTPISSWLFSSLQRIRDNVGANITINSGFRCPANRAGETDSLHRRGRAVDFRIAGMTNAQSALAGARAAQAINMPGIIMYRGDLNFTHIETRTNGRSWLRTADGGRSFSTVSDFNAIT